MTYHFQLAAVSAVGTSTASPVVDVTPATVPAAPAKLTGTATAKQAQLQWGKVTADGGSPITGYVVKGGPREVTVPPAENPSATVTGLTNGQEYSFTVVAANAAGRSADSNSVTLTPFDVPTAPRDLHGQALDSGAALNWTAPADNGRQADPAL